MPVQPPPLPGDSVGPYRLEEVLGVGGMATVYKGADPAGRPVAVKILHPGKAGTDDARRFRREFLTLRDLRHPNIVEVYEAGVQGEYPWIAMECVRGTDLGTLIERWEDAPPPDRFARVEQMLRGICEALVQVHERGLIHRDLKPSNVLVTREGRPKLTDFGVVKAPGVFTTQLTMAGRLVGTIAFMAPEQITGEAVDSRADLYSLGAVLYMMLTGRKPIEADSIAGYLSRHLTQAPVPPGEHDARVPPRLEAICLRLLQKDPSQRYASARQVLSALEQGEDPTRRIPVHGRDGVLAMLMARVEQGARGAGGVLVLTGPEGIGKSAVLAELVARARAAGHDLAAADGAAALPLHSLRSQLPVRAPTEEDLSDPGLDIADLCQGRPWTLVVDHLDQLSPMELELLTRLLRDQVAIQGEPLLLIGAARDSRGRAADLVRGLATGLTPEVIELPPLEAAAVVALVRERGLGGSAAAALGRRLGEESGGVPGTVVEQLQALEQAGWLQRKDGQLHAVRDLDGLREDPLPVPERVRSREVERMRRLSPEARALLEAVAVIGAEAPLPLVAAIAQLDRAGAHRAADQLSQAGLVLRRQRGVEELLSAGSDRIREVVMGEAEAGHRSALHLRTAAQLMGKGRRRSEALMDLVLRHLLEGGDEAAAWPLLLQSARRRLAAGQVDAARRLVRRAEELQARVRPGLSAEDAQRGAQALLLLQGELAQRQGDLTGALDLWSRALDAARTGKDPEAEARALSGLGLVHVARGEPESAILGLLAARKVLPIGDPMWAPVARALAEAWLQQGEIDRASALWHEILGVAGDMGSERIEAQARAGLAIVALAEQPLDRARQALAHAATRLRVLEDEAALVPVLLRFAEVLLADGALYEARDRAMEAERACRSARLSHARIHALGLTATALVALGTEAEARQVARDAVALARSRGQSDQVSLVLAILPGLRAMLDLGLQDEVQGLLPDPPHGLGAGLDDAPGQVMALRARLLAGREPEPAAALVGRVLARPPAPLRLATARMALDAAQALVTAGDPEALEVVAVARERCHGAGLRLWQLEVEALAARVLAGAEAGPDATARVRSAAGALDQELGAAGRFAARWEAS